MRCTQCQHRFSAAATQPAPGGSSAPGIFLIASIVFIAVSVSALLLGYPYIGWPCLAIAAFVLLQVPVALSDCRRGGECPQCGADNCVRFWSL